MGSIHSEFPDVSKKSLLSPQYESGLYAHEVALERKILDPMKARHRIRAQKSFGVSFLKTNIFLRLKTISISVVLRSSKTLLSARTRENDIPLAFDWKTVSDVLAAQQYESTRS